MTTSREGGLMRAFSRALMLLVAGGAIVAAQSTPKLPPPYHTPSADNRSQVVPRPDGAVVNVPPGFTVDAAADGFDTPRFMLLGSNQEILMSDSARATQNGGSVYVLL